MGVNQLDMNLIFKDGDLYWYHPGAGSDPVYYIWMPVE